MSAYNSAMYIGESISSVLNQTFKDLELIVVNDCSTDNTPEIIKSYSDKDPRVHLINNETNLQPAISRNKALQNAKGKYIAILDSDDIALPNRLETQYNFLEKNPDIALVGSGAEIIDENGKTIKIKRVPADFGEIKFRSIFRNLFIHSAVFYRKDPVLALGGYNDSYLHSEDYKLYTDLMDKYKITNIPEVLVKYRKNPKAISIVSSTRKIQLEHAIDVSYEYANQYINLPKNIVGLMINALHKRKVTLDDILKTFKNYKTLTRAYIAKENLNKEEGLKIWSIHKTDKEALIGQYLRQKLPGAYILGKNLYKLIR